ncbi:MAG: PspA/IM30 family protein [Pseudomonadota bacterium]
MLKTWNTLVRSLVADQEDALIDRNALPLLRQKIRDAEAGLNAAKISLTGLIKRDRLEAQQLELITARIADLEPRVRAALAADDTAQATLGATAIADLENERTARETTRTTLTARIARLRHSLSAATRRVADLKQAAATAKAVEHERRGQRSLGSAGFGSSDLSEAEALVTRILGQEDPFEAQEIAAEIDAELTGRNAADRMADAGYGAGTKTRAQDVLSRLNRKD